MSKNKMISNILHAFPGGLLCCMAAISYADDVVTPPAAVPGEYVISIDNEHLWEKAVKEMEVSSGVELAVTDTSTVGVKVKIPDVQTRIRSKKIHVNLCGNLRKHERRRRQNGEVIVRRFSRHCDANGYFTASLVPNDPYYSLMWGLQRMQMSTAWSAITGSNEVVVAVVDTGINYNHPDLAANIWQNPREIPGNGIDDDNNGYIDDVHGYNAITGSSDPMDDNGHGTHVAGTIGARTNNGEGVSGINWNVKIIGTKFLSSSGSGSLWDSINALKYIRTLKDSGVNIVATNNSWGGGSYYYALYDEINRAKDSGILFIAAAGNNSNNNDANPSYPASYEVDNVISVAAIDSNGTLASFSNYGASTVDIAAPGVNIASTWFDGTYKYLSGTSMATPHVTGAVALLKAYSAGLTWDQIKSKILFFATPNAALINKVATSGELNVLGAIQNSPYNPAIPGTPTPTPTATATPTITPTPTATPVPPTPTATMTPAPGNWALRVQDESSVGLSQVQVVVSGPNGYSSSGITGADGMLGINNLNGGNYTATFVKNGYTFQPTQLSFRVNGTTLSVVSAVKITYALKGVVLNKVDATPISNVSVDLYIDGQLVGNTTSANNGTLLFNAPFGAEYRLEISKEDFYTEHITGHITGRVTRTIALSPD